MRRKKVKGFWMEAVFAIFLSFVFVMIGALKDAHCEDPLTIYVVNYPLKFFAEGIAGPHARVMFPAPCPDLPPLFPFVIHGEVPTETLHHHPICTR